MGILRQSLQQARSNKFAQGVLVTTAKNYTQKGAVRRSIWKEEEEKRYKLKEKIYAVKREIHQTPQHQAQLKFSLHSPKPDTLAQKLQEKKIKALTPRPRERPMTSPSITPRHLESELYLVNPSSPSDDHRPPYPAISGSWCLTSNAASAAPETIPFLFITIQPLNLPPQIIPPPIPLPTPLLTPHDPDHNGRSCSGSARRAIPTTTPMPPLSWTI